MNTKYANAVNWLFEQFPAYQNIGADAYKPGLERIEQLCAHFALQPDELPFIHVAGSNGKGSVCSMIAAGLTQSGKKVGLFTSPHIQDFSERIRIDGKPISEDFVIHFVNDFQKEEQLRGYSFFEITFAMALCYFKQEQCDYCVIETGLGGRLDATNVIKPALSVITNISLEHTQFLGNTIEQIAGEKAGIIKENTPVLISESTPETAKVFTDKATSLNAPLYWSDNVEILPRADFPLLGDYQKRNYQTAVYAIQILLQSDFQKETVDDGIANLYELTGFYGRLFQHPSLPNVILDVSHNADGIKKTMDFIKENYNPENLYILYGTSADKDLKEIIPVFAPYPNFVFTEFAHARSASFEHIIDYIDQLDENFTFFDDAPTALNMLQTSTNEEDTILVIGSFFLIANIFENFL